MASGRMEKSYMDVASFRVQLLLTKMGLNNVSHLDKQRTDDSQHFHVEFNVFQYNLPDQVVKHIITQGIVRGDIFNGSNAFACMRQTSCNAKDPAAASDSLFLYLQARTNQCLVWGIEIIESLIDEALQTDQKHPNSQKPKVGKAWQNVSETDIEIKDLPDPVIKHVITKGIIEGHIHQSSGAVVYTRGSPFLSRKNFDSWHNRPLYLHIEGPSKPVVTAAAAVIERLIQEGTEENNRLTATDSKSLVLQPQLSNIKKEDGPQQTVEEMDSMQQVLNMAKSLLASTQQEPVSPQTSFARRQGTADDDALQKALSMTKQLMDSAEEPPLETVSGGTEVEQALLMAQQMLEGPQPTPTPAASSGTEVEQALLMARQLMEGSQPTPTPAASGGTEVEQALLMARQLLEGSQPTPTPAASGGTEVEQALLMARQLLEGPQPTSTPMPAASGGTEVEQALLMARQLLDGSQPMPTPDVPKPPDSMEQALMMAQQLFGNTQQSPVNTNPSGDIQPLLLGNQLFGTPQPQPQPPQSNLFQLYTQQLMNSQQSTMGNQAPTVFSPKDYAAGLTSDTQNLFAAPPALQQVGSLQQPTPSFLGDPAGSCDDQDPLSVALGKLKQIVGEDGSENQKEANTTTARSAPIPSQNEADDPQSQLLTNIIQQLQQDVAQVDAEKSGSRMPEVHLSTWHVSGFSLPADMERLDGLFYGSSDKKNWEAADRSHVICLQNTGQEMGVVEMNHYTWYCSGFDSFQNQNRGVAVLVLKSGPVKMKKFSPVSDHVCMAQLTVDSQALTLLCCLLPPNQDPDYQRVCDSINRQLERATRPVLLLGNFNAYVGKSEVSLCLIGDEQVSRLGLARHHDVTNENGIFLKRIAERYNLIFNSTVLRDKYRNPVTYIEGTSHGQISYILMSVDNKICGYMTKKCWDTGRVKGHARICMKITD